MKKYKSKIIPFSNAKSKTFEAKGREINGRGEDEDENGKATGRGQGEAVEGSKGKEKLLKVKWKKMIQT